MLTTEAFSLKLKELTPDLIAPKFLLALSGGADSMVMAALFLRTGRQFEVAHVNYKLRGEDSDEDCKIVKDWCQEYKIPFHLYEVLEKDQKPQNSVQLWARELRYRFFSEILAKNSLDLIVTAHHLNDQLETFLINLSKAAGLKGLSGIPARTEKIVRPLLSFSKNEIYSFAEQHKIVFREDASNQKDDYLRNRIRHNVVPELMNLNPRFLENFGKSIYILSDTMDFMEENFKHEFNALISDIEGKYSIKRAALAGKSPFMQFEILNKFGFSAAEIPKIFNAETGKTFFSPDFKLTVDRESLLIEEKNSTQKETNEILVAEKFCEEISLVPLLEETSGKTWLLDPTKINFPLKIRKKKPGDFFFPAGMTGRKKVSKFFKDEKISILAKQKIWLLVDGQDQILGIVPLRQDRRFMTHGAGEIIIKVKL